MKTLIHNAHVIADGFREIPCGAVLVEEGKIAALMPEADWSAQAENADEVIDAEGLMLTPGLMPREPTPSTSDRAWATMVATTSSEIMTLPFS